jgi:lipopolysaccharide/colanic/teichoic acid biosynthesis glycosyltransferase
MRARDRRAELARQRVLSEKLFKGALIRERKRADRTNQPLALLRIAMKECPGADPSAAWVQAVQAVSAAKRQTDLLGWLELGTELGVILSDVRTSDAAFVRGVEARVRQELAKRSDASAVGGFSIDFLVYPDPNGLEHEALRPVEPLLQKIQSHHERSSVSDGIKRGLDIVGSLALLALLAPLFVLIAALIKLKSPGPVFFRQVRVGQNKKPFTMLKFRTMRVNADAAIHQQYVTWFINSSSQSGDGGKTGLFKIADDPRVTPIGRILRKTSLDELPQLLNVLFGDMSLVGPRPPLFFEVEQYKRWHCRRVLEAKPGVTGLWQVTGRSRTTFDDMVRLDLRYAKTRSFRTDLKILLATPAAVFTAKGAC